MPIAVAVVTAVAQEASKATKAAVAALVGAVRRKVATRQPAQDVLDAVHAAPTDPERLQQFANELRDAAADDPSFAAEIQELWQYAAVSDHRTVNTINGPVQGNVVHARDVSGGIRFKK